MTKNSKIIVAAVTLGLLCLTQVGFAVSTTHPQCKGATCSPVTQEPAPMPPPAP